MRKSDAKTYSLRLRLFLFLFVLVLTMFAGIVMILMVTGTFSAGQNDSKQIVQSALEHSSQQIDQQYGQLSVQAVDFASDLSREIEENLDKQSFTFVEFSEHPEELEELVSDLFQQTYFTLQRSKCSGAFFILDTTVNPDLENAEYSKAGLYIKNMEPNVVSSTSPTFTLLHGSPDIGRENSINLHTQWSMEFDVRDAAYYKIPIDMAAKDTSVPLSKLYYWSDPLTLAGTSEDMMLCTVPLIDSNNNIYGVCGFEISAMLFKLSHTLKNSFYTRMICMLSPISENTIKISRSMFAGGYSVKDFTKENTFLTIKEKPGSFNTYRSNNNEAYLGFHTQTNLYPKGSPYSEEIYVTAVLVPKSDIVDSTIRLNIILVCLLSLLVTAGIIISIIFSNKYLKPISQGIEIIKSEVSESPQKTNVQEIDDLITYLADYKKDLNIKVEQEKYQLTVLEQFVEKTKTLSPAERSVFNLIIKGLSPKEIADQMYLSINTIKTHNKRIFSKLSVTSREELLLYINMLKEIGVEMT